MLVSLFLSDLLSLWLCLLTHRHTGSTQWDIPRWQPAYGSLSLSRARALALSRSRALARLLARALSLLAGSPLTVQCDIWGFGVILWELLSEQIPVLCTRVNPAHTCISARAIDYECTENPHPRIRTILQDNPCLCVCVFVCVCARAWWWCVVRSASPIDTSSDL